MSPSRPIGRHQHIHERGQIAKPAKHIAGLQRHISIYVGALGVLFSGEAGTCVAPSRMFQQTGDSRKPGPAAKRRIGSIICGTVFRRDRPEVAPYPIPTHWAAGEPFRYSIFLRAYQLQDFAQVVLLLIVTVCLCRECMLLRFRHAPWGAGITKTSSRIRRSEFQSRLAFGTLGSAHRAVVRSRHHGVSCPVAGLGLIQVTPYAKGNIQPFRATS
jgi:hypothetical protein